jgi:uroporphyrinogen-III synthase
MKVVITRSKEGNDALSLLLARSGHVPVRLDMLTFEPPADWNQIDERLRRLSEYAWVAFTSATGARMFAERAKVLGLTIPWEPPPRVAVVGDGTAAALAGARIRADFAPSEYLTETLGRELPGGGRVLLLRAERANPLLGQELKRRGFEVDEATMYRTKYAKPDGLEGIEGADAVVFGSPSAVDAVCSTLAHADLARLRRLPAVCLGPVTARAAREGGFRVVAEPEVHTFGALVEGLVEAVTA